MSSSYCQYTWSSITVTLFSIEESQANQTHDTVQEYLTTKT